MPDGDLTYLVQVLQELKEIDLELLKPSNLQMLMEKLQEQKERLEKQKELEKQKLIEEDREKREKLEQLLMDYARYLEKEPHEIAFAKIKDFFLKSK